MSRHRSALTPENTHLVMSTLASVVGNNPRLVADWKSQIAPSDDPLAQFHTKFWGVKEVPLPDATDEHKDDDDMEVDNSTAEGGDIIPGCYVLDIDIQGAAEDKIWVRADYIRMFKFAEKFYAENACNTLSPCLVITGQPGIGELR